MKYVDEFRNLVLARKLTDQIRRIMPAEKINLMEVCGTHTQNFCRFGLDKLLPQKLRLISGPGCPVCVSPAEYIDTAIELSKEKQLTIATFGDMLRIPGSKSSLEQQRAIGAQVEIVYSPLETIALAKKHPRKNIVFLAVGFETTAPTIAATILQAKKAKLKNLYFLSSLKLIPPAMKYLLKDKRLKLNGFLCPGHVSAVIGTKPYEFIPKDFSVGCCVAGFEPLDILEGIYLLLRQIVKRKPRVENQYQRVVTREGNCQAQKIMQKVFLTSDSIWRSLGRIPHSGLSLRQEFAQFDAVKNFSIKRPRSHAQGLTKCKCSDILKGLVSPLDCPLFSGACSPEHPVGPCMVSREGACNAYYRYH
ncbi:MAG: hydrogenase formation protein HypD [Candidatus Omnitrophica bacterium]|nr:hydrogenase formation protein HypD [Candidatus Omnitrophota bacterium]